VSSYISYLTPLTDTAGPITIESIDYDGRLYDISNSVPAGHNTEGIAAGEAVVKRNAAGTPAANGLIGWCGIGMSNARRVLTELLPLMSSKQDAVVTVNAAQTNRDLDFMIDNEATYYAEVDDKLDDKGLTPEQVGVILLYTAIAGPTGSIADHIAEVKAKLKTVIVDQIAVRYPNCKQVYLVSREYGGYTLSGNPEPYAFAQAIAIRELVLDQVYHATTGDPDLDYAAVPWLGWTTNTYTWANGLGSDEVEGGTPGRADGLEYLESDFDDDLHPSVVGATKIANLILPEFESGDYAAPWWYAALDPEIVVSKIDTDGDASTTLDSYTPTADVYHLLVVANRAGVAATAEQPVPSGNSATYSLEDTITFPASNRNRISVFRFIGTGTAGAPTITFNSQVQTTIVAVIIEIPDIYTGGTNGSLGVIESITNSGIGVTNLEIATTTSTNVALMIAAFSNTGNFAMNEQTGFFEEYDDGGSRLEIQSLVGHSSPAKATKAAGGTFDVAGILITLRLPPPKYLLEVTATGPGTVTSSPAGISVRNDTADYEFYEGEEVSLTAGPETGAMLQAWGGDFDSINGLVATVTIDGAHAITAVFVVMPALLSVEQTAAYEVWLCTDLGQRLALLDTAWFEYSLVVNGVGAFTVMIAGDAIPESMLDVDRQVQFWRRPVGSGSLALDQIGFLRKWEYSTDDSGITRLKLMGPDVNDLLRRRIVAYAAGTANAAMNTTADNGLKDLFETNYLADATDADREIQANGVTVQGNLSDGPTIEKAFSWRSVLQVMQEIALASRTAGNEVFFAVIWTGIDENDVVQFQFRTWTGQPGKDRTWPDGDNPVVFGLEWGNLISPRLVVDHSDEINYVYAGGQGEGTDRLIVEVSDTTRIARSVWNRREGFKDARSEATTNGVTAMGNALLAEMRPRERFSGQIVDTEETPYGRAWHFGDRVSAVYIGRQFDEIIRTVYVSVNEGGREIIKGSLDGGSLIDSPAIEVLIRNTEWIKGMVNFMQTLQDTKYKGTKASDFTTSDLPRHGEYGFQTATNEVQINGNGTIRKIATT
jgi:hypothetical protein